MSIHSTISKSCAILGHTATGMGERVLTKKITTLLVESGVEVVSVVDVVEHLGDKYEKLATLNYDLADGGHALLEGIDSWELPSSDLLLILSWCFSVAAVFATDVRQSRLTVAKLYAHHTNERILPELYKPADLLITESLLANERGAAYGIAPEKMLYLPHTYVPSKRKVSKEKRRVIGTVSRLEYGKNCEFAIEAVRRLAEKGHEVVLVLKGGFPEETLYPEYKALLTQMLEAYQHEPWLIWDQEATPFPDVIEEYTRFDLLLHPSGAEGGSHVVVECLGLGIPCVVLECSTNPFLFNNLATFVQTSGTIRPAQLPFYIPDLDDLVAQLEKELPPPDPARVAERFHPDVARERIPLLFEPDPEKIAALYKKDCLLYGI